MTTNNLDHYFDKQPGIVDKDMKISLFNFQIKCAPWPFVDDFKIQYSNIFYQGIFEAISAAGIPKNSLTFTPPEVAVGINQQKGEGTTGWFGIGYNEPGKSFGITIDDKTFQIQSANIRLQDLVFLAQKVFSRITSALSSEALAAPYQLNERAHTIGYYFHTNHRLGNDKVQNTKVKNYDVLSEALFLDRKPGGKGTKSVENAFPSLGVEKYIRLDMTQHALKTIDGNNYNTALTIEGPMNEGNSRLELNAGLRMEEEFGFDLQSGLNWNTAFISFYREIILKRFFENLLCSTEAVSN